MRRLSNYLCGAEQKPSEALGNTHTCVLPLPRRPYRRCGLFVCGSSPYRHSERSVGIQRSESKSSACVHSTQIAIYHLRQRRKYQASDIAKLRLEFLSLLELIVCIGCAEQNKNLAWLSAILTIVSLRGTQLRGNLA